MHNIAEFAAEMRRVAQECMRVLKPNKHCTVLIRDTWRNKHFVPITHFYLIGHEHLYVIRKPD